MVNLPRCIGQGRLQVLRLQIREVREDLLAALASGKELIVNAYPELGGEDLISCCYRIHWTTKVCDPVTCHHGSD